MDDEVAKFEESVFFFADAHRLHGPGSKFRDPYAIDLTSIEKSNVSGATTPSLTPGSSTPLSISSNDSKCSSLGYRPPNPLNSPLGSGELAHGGETIQDNDLLRESDIHAVVAKNNVEILEAWQLEAARVDRAIQILPGVKRIIDSIPAGRYAVATSGTKNYGNFRLPYILLTT